MSSIVHEATTLFLHRHHKDEVAGDIFDMLLTFTDFLAFKEMFLDYRAVSPSCLLRYSEPLRKFQVDLSGTNHPLCSRCKTGQCHRQRAACQQSSCWPPLAGARGAYEELHSHSFGETKGPRHLTGSLYNQKDKAKKQVLIALAFL